MTWNHRVMRRVCDDEVCYGVHEVFDIGDGKLSWTAEPVAPHYNETTDAEYSLRADFERQLKALNWPILDYETGKEIE